MSKLIEKISRITILLLGLVSALLVVLIYVGGNAESITVGGDALTVPKFTEPLLYWCYFLIALTIGITLILTLVGFVKKLVENPAAGLKSLIPMAIFVVIFVIAWFLGSPDKISIIGYEGTENQGAWAQFTDMIIYAIYALFIGIIGTIAGAGIYTKMK
ncbi:MAG: hypothetical protein LLF95_10365 [Bacteroidales bacterium]|nr:hypothetical protein [Bacteroidales bacterium]